MATDRTGPPESPVQRLLEALGAHGFEARSSGSGWVGRCPTHDDEHASLSIGQGSDGRALLKCFAGCKAEDIVRALDLTMADLFREGVQRRRAITVRDLSFDKRLPEDFLRSVGLTDRDDGVVIEYRLADGNPAPRQRLRTALRAKDGSLWLLGRGKVTPYGLDRIDEARHKGYLILVEGESDCWTLWFHGFPALGIPGADMARKLESGHIAGVPRVYVFREPDGGGETFVGGVTAHLAQLHYKGSVLTVQLEGVKDPNALHQADPAQFKAAFQRGLDNAGPLDLPEPQQPSNPATSNAAVLTASGVSKLSSTSSSEDVEHALRQLASLVRDVDSLNRELTRQHAVEHLKAMGFSSPAKLVDAALGKVRSAQSDDLSGQTPFLSDPEPWSEPVDGVVLLDRLAETLTRYLVLPARAEQAIALWIVHCYAFDALWVSPFLTITSPQKRCGKSTLLVLLGSLVPRRLLASNISPAAMFRSIEKFRPTLLIDEGDTSLVSNDELRGILNGGHTRDTAWVVRSVGDQHEPRQFSTWCPKAMALIGRLRDTLEDRSIIVQLKRKTKTEKVARLPRRRIHELLEPLRRQAARWAADHLAEIEEAEPSLPESLDDRAQDNWGPLLAIADAAGGDWPDHARQAALALAGSDDMDEGSAGVMLLEDLRHFFRDRDTDRLSSAEIVDALVELEDRPWPEWRREKPLTATSLAKLLKPFGIRPRTIRTAGKTEKGYLREACEDAFSRYLPSEPSHRNNGGISSKFDDSKPSQDSACDGSENTEKERNGALVTGVTVGEARNGTEREEFDL